VVDTEDRHADAAQAERGLGDRDGVAQARGELARLSERGARGRARAGLCVGRPEPEEELQAQRIVLLAVVGERESQVARGLLERERGQRLLRGCARRRDRPLTRAGHDACRSAPVVREAGGRCAVQRLSDPPVQARPAGRAQR
jgi:hypothetical protein